MQQLNHRSWSGTKRVSSAILVVGATPVIKRRRPRPEASNSTASVIREAPPVSATIPSAMRSSDSSSLAIWSANHKNPPSRIAKAIAGAAQTRPTPWPHHRLLVGAAALMGWSSTIMIIDDASEYVQIWRLHGSTQY